MDFMTQLELTNSIMWNKKLEPRYTIGHVVFTQNDWEVSVLEKTYAHNFFYGDQTYILYSLLVLCLLNIFIAEPIFRRLDETKEYRDTANGLLEQ
jgi:hypothetical protein